VRLTPDRRLEPASADLVLLLAVTTGALNYSVVKFAVSQIQPLAFTLIRFAIGGLGLLLVLRIREGSTNLRRSDIALMALAGILGIGFGQMLLVLGLSNTGASDMALLAATTPMVTSLLARAAGIERFGRHHWAALAIGFVGVLLIVLGGTDVAIGSKGLLGDLFGLAAVLLISGSLIVLLPLSRRYSAHRILTYEMLVGSAVLLPFAVPSLLAQDYRAITPAGWASLAYGIAVSAVATNLLYFTAIGRIGPSRTTTYQYLQTFLGVLFAVIILGEHVTVAQVAGGIVVIVGIVLSRTRRANRSLVDPSASTESGG
jgi:drug/metabolite transporter (DMT)-like permease